MEDEFWQDKDCERATGIPAATWRNWVHRGEGPKNFKLGRRRVWRKSVVLQWIADQESAVA